MGDITEYVATMALALAFWSFLNHQRAVRRAREDGGEVPGLGDLAWRVVAPIAALGVGFAAGLTYLATTFKPGEGWGGLVHFGAAYVVGFLAAGMTWLLLVVVGGAGGPFVQGILVLAAAVVVWVGVVQPLGMTRGISLTHFMPQAPSVPRYEPPPKVLDYERAGEGVVPAHIIDVSGAGASRQVGNRTGQALLVTVNKVLRREGSSGYDRCLMAVEHVDTSRPRSSMRAIDLEFKPEVAPGASVLFASSCELRFHHAPLEFRIETAQGKTLFMSDTAFQ